MCKPRIRRGTMNTKLLTIILIVALAIPAFATPQTATKFVLEDGTPVKLVLGDTISSADERVGNLVNFEVVEDVLVNGTVVIPRGSNAWATVTVAEPKKRMGRGGKLDINIDKVRLADGEKVLLRAVKGVQGGGHQGAMVGAMVATSLLVWPAAPFFLLMHGKDITIPTGNQVTAFIQGDAVLDPAKFTPEAPKAAAPVTQTTEPIAKNSPIPAEMNGDTPQRESLGDYARKLNAQKETHGVRSQQ
jgi:hypothetical protein